MCRNIKRLYNLAPPATEAEVEASALQYVRKLSGMTRPSEANREAFERAVAQITAISMELLHDQLQTRAAPRDREIEAERARERGRRREEQLRRRLLGEA